MSEVEIPMKCRICWYCEREKGKCSHPEDDHFIEDCDEFKFEPLYLIDVLEEFENE